VQRAQQAVAEIRKTLDRLSQRGAVSVPDVAAAICETTLRATTPGRPPPPRRGCADDSASVFDGTPFSPCPPGPWAVGRHPGDPHAGPQCSCGEFRCEGRGHFAAVDVVELYDMHCRYVCSAHECDAAHAYVDRAAHESCPIHTLLTLLSGAWVPWRDELAEPTAQLRARRIVTEASSPEGQFVSEQLRKGLDLDLWEKLSPEQAADFGQCAIVEAGFAALVGKLKLSPAEAVVVNDNAASVDVRPIEAAAARRAAEFVASLPPGATRERVSKTEFAKGWQAQGGGDKHRFCVAHNRFLNRGARGWPLSFPTAHAILETSFPGDVFITRDHKSGYSVVLIRPDQRRFFCFFDPVTGDIYRCKRLDFGWALSPGIFCAFTAELNAIVSSRLVSEVDSRALSRYYVDDCIARVPRGGAPAVVSTPEGPRHCSTNEAAAVAILEEVSRRANFPTSPEKVRWGPAVVYLGLHIESATRQAIVMPTKLFKCLVMLHVLRLAIDSGRIDVPVSYVLKAAGNAQWLAQNFRLGRMHTPSLWLASELLRERRARGVTDCPGLLSACEWWITAAADGRLQPHRFVCALDIPSLMVSLSLTEIGGEAAHGIPAARPRHGATRPVAAVLSDASGEEEAGALGGCWTSSESEGLLQAFYAALTPEERAWRAICAKELLAIVLWLERFGAEHRGAVVLFGTDNAGNVFTVNRLRVDAGDAVMAGLLGRMLAAADAHDIECLVWWCPRGLNGIADDLSKCPTLADARRVALRLGLTLR